ncbi:MULTISPECIES: ribonuclease [unclassified Brevundimonas]|uniref:ribonuclease n=1 Tax=unclassified Brevundimonas TaxID=2622653 RepID=UPI001FD798DD|nr:MULTISPECIES: ribonuclease [unclassified Brevundimonas]
MTDQDRTLDAREADDIGEKPDLGRKPDALSEALSGSDLGSDTRAGSLRGGSASGSDIDPDQKAINESLASEGMASADAHAGEDKARNDGDDPKTGGDADAATG